MFTKVLDQVYFNLFHFIDYVNPPIYSKVPKNMFNWANPPLFQSTQESVMLVWDPSLSS